MKIINLKAENVKKLLAVDITPDGEIVIVGGKNANGKSSVLDSIFYALGGSKALPEQPIRNGAKKAKINVELGEHGQVKYVVERTITEGGGGGLRVKAADGALYPSPQKLLDEICSQIAFDPLEFSRLKPRDQAEQLRELLGAEFTHKLAELDARHKETFDERTLRNRELKNARAQLQGLAEPEGDATDGGELPEAEVDVAELTDELTRREDFNASVDCQVRNLQAVEQEIATGNERLEALETEIKRLVAELNRAREREGEFRKKLHALDHERHEIVGWLHAKENQPLDTTEIREQIKTAAAVNARVQRARAAQAQRQELIQKVRTLESDSEQMTAELAKITQEKQAVLAGAPFPVPGLGFSETGVTYQGLPFDQASGAEKLRVSVAMGMALNPKLRVMTIRDASLLDNDGLKMVAEMARDDDYQVWLERAGDSPTGCEVWIEDGQVKQLPQRSLFGDESEAA